MKKNILYGACIVVLSMFGKAAGAQTLFFIYIGPTAVMDSTFGVANTFGFTTVTSAGVVPSFPGYRGVVVTAANQAQFRAISAPLMRRTYDSINLATSAVRVKLNKVLSLVGNRLAALTILMTDDRGGIPNTPNVCAVPGNGGIFMSWPCASNWRDSASGTYRGRVSLGELAAREDTSKAGGFRRWEATIIHEFSHTQMLRDTAGINKWDNRASGVSGIAISYGGDRGHWFEELQADQQQPMDEGLGYYWALEHNPPMAAELDVFLNRTTSRFLLGSRSFLSGTSAMWNAPHTIRCSGLPCITPGGDTLRVALNTAITPATGGYELRYYRWLDVPGEYALYNEWMSEAYFYLMHRYSFNSRDTAYNKIFDGVRTLCVHANQRWRYPAHMANMMANSMEAYARTTQGRTDETNGVLVSSMFAYALYDLLGHFGQSDDALRREFDIQSATYIPHTPKPIAYTRYFAIRNQVRQIACPFLGGNANCAASASGAIDIHGAVTAVRNYFRDASRILR